jgi:hypothetical protein
MKLEFYANDAMLLCEGLGTASPDLEKQGFLAAVFINWEESDSGKPDFRRFPSYSMC